MTSSGNERRLPRTSATQMRTAPAPFVRPPCSSPFLFYLDLPTPPFSFFPLLESPSLPLGHDYLPIPLSFPFFSSSRSRSHLHYVPPSTIRIRTSSDVHLISIATQPLRCFPRTPFPFPFNSSLATFLSLSPLNGRVDIAPPPLNTSVSLVLSTLAASVSLPSQQLSLNGSIPVSQIAQYLLRLRSFVSPALILGLPYSLPFCSSFSFPGPRRYPSPPSRFLPMVLNLHLTSFSPSKRYVPPPPSPTTTYLACNDPTSSLPHPIRHHFDPCVHPTAYPRSAHPATRPLSRSHLPLPHSSLSSLFRNVAFSFLFSRHSRDSRHSRLGCVSPIALASLRAPCLFLSFRLSFLFTSTRNTRVGSRSRYSLHANQYPSLLYISLPSLLYQRRPCTNSLDHDSVCVYIRVAPPSPNVSLFFSFLFDSLDTVPNYIRYISRRLNLLLSKHGSPSPSPAPTHHCTSTRLEWNGIQAATKSNWSKLFRIPNPEFRIVTVSWCVPRSLRGR
ncbi:hypothetical protein B0H12DRAFT_743782 [Mycena haematopus]|nr:hypothetical protein B0H12DRAFT_743782 [Mycena haematopus]